MAISIARRHREAVILSEMMLIIHTSLHKGYRRKHAGSEAPELLVSFVIRANDGNGGKPVTVADISKKLGIPRGNICRHVKELLDAGMIRKIGNGYAGEINYLKHRLDPPYWRDCRNAIINAADALRELEAQKK
jgi:hypothetical protein